MAEYIKREDVQNMLDNVQIVTDAEGEYFGYCTEDVDVNSIPAADVVEAVRCKDCRWYDENAHTCELYGVKHWNGFFCADGEVGIPHEEIGI